MSDEPNLANGSMLRPPGNPQRTAVILLSSTLLVLLWKYLGSEPFFLDRLAVRWNVANPESAAAAYRFISGFVLLGFVPALIVRFGFRERLVNYGVGLGIPKFTFRTMVIAVPLFAIGGTLATMASGARDELLSNPELGQAIPLGLHICTLLIFYMGWEFHYRGFLQFGLAGPFGKTNAVLVQVMASSLVHIGDPPVETFGAIAGGILWGWLAFRTRSILSGMMQHFALGLAVDLIAAYYSD